MAHDSVPNAARSALTREALIDAALECLVDIGYARTTGVEVCRRAGLTRGALQYHFPDFGDLLAAALHAAYQHALRPVDVPGDAGPLERWVLQAHARVVQPEFKAVVELWLASQNDPRLGDRLGDAMAHGAALFGPSMTLKDGDGPIDATIDAVYRTILEAFIGLGLGRATNGSRPLDHEDAVVGQLLDLARRHDERSPT